MVQRQPTFYDAFQKNDPEFYEVVSAVNQKTRAGSGALDAKTRILISLALDTAAGASQGVKNLAQRARELGASEDEIREVMRVVYVNKGHQALATAQSAFEE
ncbi:carboxymuconolactone decarboxylase family protein [Chloroflexota bacterium]